MPIRRDRIVPLIIAVALFMENMDSTVIATSLPAIATDIGTNPLALKLAITSYLLSLAIFIPASGWTADRFGARTVFRAAIAVFVLGSIGCALSNSLTDFVIARIVQGMGGAMMTPVGRMVLVRSIEQARTGQRHGLGDDAGADRPDARTAGRRLHHHLRVLALDLHHQRADRPHRHFARHPLHRGSARRAARAFRHCRHGAGRPRHCWRRFRLPILRYLGARLNYLPWTVVVALIVGGVCFIAAYLVHARHTAVPALDLTLFRLPTFFASVTGGFIFRLGLGALPFLLPLMLQVGFGMTPFQSGMVTFATALGAMGMKWATATILRRFGFRTILVINAVASSAFLAVCATFTQTTPVAVMVALLLVGGFFRSLQFTSINTIAYAEVEPARVSRATALLSVAPAIVGVDRGGAGRASGGTHGPFPRQPDFERGRLSARLPGSGGDLGDLGVHFRAAFARRRGGTGQPVADADGAVRPTGRLSFIKILDVNHLRTLTKFAQDKSLPARLF